MPTIRIDYDDSKLKDEDILFLSNATQKIVQSITGIEDTFVYANSPHIKVKVAPIEIYIQISSSKIPDIEILFSSIKNQISDWKKINSLSFPINLTLMPMDWKFDINI